MKKEQLKTLLVQMKEETQHLRRLNNKLMDSLVTKTKEQDTFCKINTNGYQSGKMPLQNFGKTIMQNKYQEVQVV